MNRILRLSALVFAAMFLAPQAAIAQAQPSYQGLWWNSPAGSENGWGLNLTHQGTIIFGTWFTYDTDGRGMWLVLPRADLVQVDEMDPGGGYGYGYVPMPSYFAYTGILYRPKGPAFDSPTFDGTTVELEDVGRATIRFTNADNGTFAYTVGSVSGAKLITRLVYAQMPMCDFGAPPSAAAPVNYQDLWWRSPAGSESGWGVNITHQGDILFATWFTYDSSRRALWFVMSEGVKTGAGTYSGKLYRTTGPPYNASSWNGDDVDLIEAGNATFSFSDRANGTFTATVDNATQVKPITRLVFSEPSTVCR